MCDCHDSEQEHERWAEEEQAYWLAYFGGPKVIKNAVESERFYREYGEPE